MTERNMQKALEEAKRVVGMIEADQLTDEQKKAIHDDSIKNFNENVNPGWLEYRKSVSTDAAFVEWEDEGDVFRDLNGVEFIDCLGGFGIFACGHGNPEIRKTVQAQLERYSLHSQELVDPLRGYLANLLGMITPGDLQYCFFCNGGAETPVDATTRSLFAYVPQGNLLLSGTIRENLCITRPGATEDEINQAVLASGMDAFLPTLPLGLDTVLGESGAGLSEGQAQRLSIARAVLSQAPILLLDEATSALDAETEKLVLQRLKNLPNKTCIAVTHKPAPMEQCDWILEVGESGCTLRNNK